jgi:hypothetical protein
MEALVIAEPLLGLDTLHQDEATARRMARSFRDYVDAIKGLYRCTTDEAIGRAEGSDSHPDYPQYVMNAPLEDLSWSSLWSLSDEDFETRWSEIKREVRSDLNEGIVACEAYEGTVGSTPLSRARFLAARRALVEEWKPSGGAELQLIDTLTQAYLFQQQWTKVLADRTRIVCDEEIVKRPNRDWVEWRPPRQTEAGAIEQAMTMIERFNRVYLRTLRALRDLRRYSTSIQINNAAQVNIGEKQINVQSQK